jgi:hypothetical protein
MNHFITIAQKVQQNLELNVNLLGIIQKMRYSGINFAIHETQCPINTDHELFFIGNEKELAFVRCNKGCNEKDICNTLGISIEDLSVSSFWKSNDCPSKTRGIRTVGTRGSCATRGSNNR